MDRHWDENTKVLVLVSTGDNKLLLKLILPSLRSNTKLTTLTTLPTLCITGKLDSVT